MSATIKNSIQAIPISAFPPISLERPLKLFGNTFKVHISTGLTLSPDTLLKSALGISLQQWLRSNDKDAHSALKNLMRGATGKNKLSGTTKWLIKQKLGTAYASDVIDDLLDGREPSHPPPRESDWETLQRAMGEPGGDDMIYALVERFAFLDRLLWSVRQKREAGSVEEGNALLLKHIGNPHESWAHYNPNLKPPVMFLVDISLQTLALMELRSMLTQSNNLSDFSASQLLTYLAPGKKPIGHWLLRVQESASCSNFRELGDFMASRGVKRHSYYVSHDLLKKWSSGVQLMPYDACQCILKAFDGKLDADHHHGWFAIARFLSFLCDLVIAGTHEKPPSWAVAQDQIRSRYAEIYAQEYSRLLAY